MLTALKHQLPYSGDIHYKVEDSLCTLEILCHWVELTRSTWKWAILYFFVECSINEVSYKIQMSARVYVASKKFWKHVCEHTSRYIMARHPLRHNIDEKVLFSLLEIFTLTSNALIIPHIVKIFSEIVWRWKIFLQFYLALKTCIHPNRMWKKFLDFFSR